MRTLGAEQVGQDQIQPCSLPAFSPRAPRRGALAIDRRRAARRFRHLTALMRPAPRRGPSLVVAGLGQIILDLARRDVERGPPPDPACSALLSWIPTSSSILAQSGVRGRGIAPKSNCWRVTGMRRLPAGGTVKAPRLTGMAPAADSLA